MNIGIIGAGWIAAKLARTLKAMQGAPSLMGRAGGEAGCVGYAIAARDLERAEAFAAEWGFAKAYGSYEELVSDPLVDLVYIATPHSHHYPHTRLALEHGKACLVEKAFTANAREAEELICLAREKHVLLAEAVWTRYQPIREMLQKVLDEGVIGRPRLVTASLCYPMPTKERILRPELCGGAMLDLGVYCLNFVRMFFPGEWTTMHNHATLAATGVDMSDSITAIVSDATLCASSERVGEGRTRQPHDGLVCCLQANALCQGDNMAVIRGEKGRIEIDNVNNPQHVSVYGPDRELLRELVAPPCATGYEYEVLACRDALEQGLTECPAMPLDETLAVMQLMDRFRKDCGVVFPMD